MVGPDIALRIAPRRGGRGTGRAALAALVAWTAKGDGAGCDVASFDAYGPARLVEVKTTNGAADTAFYVTPNEVRVSRERAPYHWLYRVHGFAKEPRIYTIRGALDGGALRMEPIACRRSR